MVEFRAEQLIETETLEKLLKEDYEIQSIELDKDYFRYEISRADLFKIHIFSNGLETETIQNKLEIVINKKINVVRMYSYIDNTLATTIHTKKENKLILTYSI